MEETLLLALVALIWLVVGPILGMVAFVKARRLEQTVAALERRLGSLPPAGAPVDVPHAATVRTPAASVPALPAPEPVPVVEPVPVPRTPAVAATPAPAAPAARLDPVPTTVTLPTGFDWENLIAGRWLNRIGLTAVAIGVAYFLKHAIDNDWIGPQGQVALGLLSGTALLAWAPWFVRKGLVYFAEGLTGLGAAILYLSLWAAGNYYGFLSPAATFAAMAVVTAAMLAIAVGRDSQRIAVMAMLGGFLTPALVSTGRDAQVELFTYLALLNLALLVLAWQRNWRVLELPAFVMTELYFLAWYDRFYTSARLTSTAGFAALFFVQFSSLTTIRSRRTGTLYPEQALLSVVNTFIFLLVLRELLWPGHRWALAASTLALAVFYLASARAVSSSGAGTPHARMLFAGLSLTCVTLAIPMALDGSAITIAWSVEAAVLVWTGFAAGLRYLRAAGLLLFAMVAMRLVMFPIHATVFLWNARFAIAIVTAAAAGVALACAWKWREQLSKDERPAFAALAVGINVLLISTLTAEVVLYYHPVSSFETFDRESQLAESLAVSLLWTAYASLLLTLGIRFSSALLRWQALVLFAIVTIKVFVADLSFLRGFYRIISSIALGVVLIVISYLYQRRLAAKGDQ
jgi:uncharacterized membrane protein